MNQPRRRVHPYQGNVARAQAKVVQLRAQFRLAEALGGFLTRAAVSHCSSTPSTPRKSLADGLGCGTHPAPALPSLLLHPAPASSLTWLLGADQVRGNLAAHGSRYNLETHSLKKCVRRRQMALFHRCGLDWISQTLRLSTQSSSTGKLEVQATVEVRAGQLRPVLAAGLREAQQVVDRVFRWTGRHERLEFLAGDALRALAKFAIDHLEQLIACR